MSDLVIYQNILWLKLKRGDNFNHLFLYELINPIGSIITGYNQIHKKRSNPHFYSPSNSFNLLFLIIIV
jgi:hypothetical protein